MPAVRYAIPMLALVLSACAPRLILANELGGTVSQTGSMGNDRALAMAETHCAKFGKQAKIVDRTVWVKSFRFDCVAK